MDWWKVSVLPYSVIVDEAWNGKCSRYEVCLYPLPYTLYMGRGNACIYIYIYILYLLCILPIHLIIFIHIYIYLFLISYKFTLVQLINMNLTNLVLYNGFMKFRTFHFKFEFICTIHIVDIYTCYIHF